MYCSKCGKEIFDNTNFCSHCKNDISNRFIVDAEKILENNLKKMQEENQQSIENQNFEIIFYEAVSEFINRNLPKILDEYIEAKKKAEISQIRAQKTEYVHHSARLLGYIKENRFLRLIDHEFELYFVGETSNNDGFDRNSCTCIKWFIDAEKRFYAFNNNYLSPTNDFLKDNPIEIRMKFDRFLSIHDFCNMFLPLLNKNVLADGGKASYIAYTSSTIYPDEIKLDPIKDIGTEKSEIIKKLDKMFSAHFFKCLATSISFAEVSFQERYKNLRIVKG